MIRRLRRWWYLRHARKAGISNDPLSPAQMQRAIQRSKREGWKDIKP